MPFTNGIFARAYNWVADAAADLGITPSRMDADLNDIALGLSNAILRDGTGSPTADISFAGHAATNLKAPANAGDALSLGSTPASEITRALGGTALLAGNNLTDLASAAAAIGALGFVASLSTQAGYFKIPAPGGGFLILQYLTLNATSDGSFSWPLVFPNACLCSGIFCGGSNGSSGAFAATMDTPSKSGGTYRARYINNGGAVGVSGATTIYIFGLGN